MAEINNMFVYEVAQRISSFNGEVTKDTIAALLKFSKQRGACIRSKEDYDALKEQFQTLENVDDVSRKIIDAFLAKVDEEYPVIYDTWLDGKSADREKWSEKLSPASIDELITSSPELNAVSQGQLKNIRDLIEEYPNHKIQSKRVSVRDGLVEIDGVILPTKRDKARPESITNDNVLHTTYPNQAKTLLMFAADIIGSTFHFGNDTDRNKLQNGELSNNESNDLVSILDNRSNRVVMGVLCQILGYAYTIYLGVDSNGSVPFVGAIDSDGLSSAGRYPAGRLVGHPISFSPSQQGSS